MTYESFANDTWKHYAIPRRQVKAKKGKTAPQMDSDNVSTMILGTRKKTGTQSVEQKTLELIDVRFVGGVNWKKKFKSLVNRNWKFKEFLDDEQLARLERELPDYVYRDPVVIAPVGEKKVSGRSKNRKRKRVDNRLIMLYIETVLVMC